MTRRLLRARRVIDGAGGVIDGGAVLVADAQIQAVGRSVDVGRPAMSRWWIWATARCCQG
jgi:imidazolonepropionase-like amidohydrolase